MVWLLPDLHLPGFLWFNAMDHAGKASANIHVSPRHPAQGELSNEDSHTIMAWPTPELRQRGFRHQHGLGKYQPRQLRQWHWCRLWMVDCAAGQFIALASSTALAEATSVWSAAGALPWLARAARKW
mgnify:CR=1 FL=1